MVLLFEWYFPLIIVPFHRHICNDFFQLLPYFRAFLKFFRSHSESSGTSHRKFRYIIELTDTDRKTLLDTVAKGASPAKTILRANILLASDKNNKKHMTVAEIAEAYHTTPTTVQNVRTSYANYGLDATINRKKRTTPPVPPKVTGDVEAHIIALACGEPPEGYSKWTLRLLAEKCVELNYAESLSHVTVSRVLKKTNLSLT